MCIRDSFLFMPFAAWFAGVTLEPLQCVQLVTGGVLALFGDMIMTVTFLLRQPGLPAESLNLFVATGPPVSNTYGRVEPATMAFFSVAVGALVLGLGRPKLRRALVAGLVALVVVGVGTAGLAVALRPLADSGATSYATLRRMQVALSVPSHVYRSRAEAPAPPKAPAGADSVLAQVQQRGVLRVGYVPTANPFSYFNGAHELVGIDVQRAYTLAGLLQCTRVDFIPEDRQYFPADLASGFVDIVVGAIQVTPDLYEKVDFTAIYLGLRVALVVPDPRAGDYKTTRKLDRLKGRRLAVERAATTPICCAWSPPTSPSWSWTIRSTSSRAAWPTRCSAPPKGLRLHAHVSALRGGSPRPSVPANVPRLSGAQGRARVDRLSQQLADRGEGLGAAAGGARLLGDRQDRRGEEAAVERRAQRAALGEVRARAAGRSAPHRPRARQLAAAVSVMLEPAGPNSTR